MVCRKTTFASPSRTSQMASTSMLSYCKRSRNTRGTRRTSLLMIKRKFPSCCCISTRALAKDTVLYHHGSHSPPTQWIGYGHRCLPTISQSDCATIHPPILEDEATALLSKDVKAAEDCVCRFTKTDKLNGMFSLVVDRDILFRNTLAFLHLSYSTR